MRQRSKILFTLTFIVLGFLFQGILPNKILAQTVTESVEIHFIDVGQGDSILIKTDTKKVILIDAGDRDQGFNVVRYLKDHGVEKIDLMVSTHPHADHIGGFLSVLKNFPVERILDSGVPHTSKLYEDYLNLIFQKSIPFEIPEPGNEYNFSGLSLKVLGPTKTHDELNNNSIILKLKFNDITAIFTGDAEKEAEIDILSMDIEAQILKVGHHGSETATSERFLNEVNPKDAIISVGKGNRYGHPEEITLHKFIERGVNIYRTDEQGTIVITITGSKYQINKSPNTFTTDLSVTSLDQFVGSVNSNKYHLPTCRYAKSIDLENKIWFKTIEEALKANYIPCGVCKPPTK
ncbi:MAG: MBL fold metallo-hydrolase [Halanaerobiales bacterium]|nr:MBL fold metallo-hydrolase [Halanaerobiales bacterium]